MKFIKHKRHFNFVIVSLKRKQGKKLYKSCQFVKVVVRSEDLKVFKISQTLLIALCDLQGHTLIYDIFSPSLC